MQKQSNTFLLFFTGLILYLFLLSRCGEKVCFMNVDQCIPESMKSNNTQTSLSSEKKSIELKASYPTQESSQGSSEKNYIPHSKFNMLSRLPLTVEGGTPPYTFQITRISTDNQFFGKFAESGGAKFVTESNHATYEAPMLGDKNQTRMVDITVTDGYRATDTLTIKIKGE